MKYIYQFTQTIDLHVPHEERVSLNMALNQRYMGSIMPSGKPSAEHEEAAWHSHRVHRIDIRVGVTDDGRLHLINGEDLRLLREIVRQTVRLHHDPNATVDDRSADTTITLAREAITRADKEKLLK